jgi:hypothetical protein
MVPHRVCSRRRRIAGNHHKNRTDRRTTMTAIQGWHNNVWGDVGSALYDVPGAELVTAGEQLRELAHANPGRTGDLFAAFVSMIDTELAWRAQAMAMAIAMAGE